MDEEIKGAPLGRPTNATVEQIVDVAASVDELTVNSLEEALRARYGRGVTRHRLMEVVRAEKTVRFMSGAHARAHLQETIRDAGILGAYLGRVRADEERVANGATPEGATANVDRILNSAREELLRTVAAVTEAAAVQLRLEREQAAERERIHLSQLRETRDDFEAELNRLLLECNDLQRELRSAEQRRGHSEAQLELLKHKLENADRIAVELKAKLDAEQGVVDLLKRQLDEERSRSEGVLYRLAELENRQAPEFLATAAAKSGVTLTSDEA